MKKFNIVLIALIPALIFISASVWEGSAAVSAAGEFPEGAYYVATDSFPRNTVVDVTNLENGRTIRVIVSAGLDSPGLLAMLSRNAAFAIGIQSRDIARIRMTQPSDPVAYSRFTEDREQAGGPESAQSAAGRPGAAVVSSPIRIARTGDLAGATPEDQFYSSVINRSETYNPPPVRFPSDGSVQTEARPAWLPGEDEPAPLIAEAPVPETVPEPVPDVSLIAVPAPEPASPPPVLVAPAPQPPAAAMVPPPPPPVTTPVPAPQPPAATAVPPPPPPVISLVPAEERPPQGAVAIPQGTIAPVPPLDASKDDTYLDPRFFIGPIPPLQRPVPRSAPPAVISSAPAPRQVPAPSGPVFSVPVDSRLEGGKYYIQIGAFSQPGALEVAAARVNKRYPLMVQPGGSPNNLVYRLLIGPLTVGESGAVLQRLKSAGYPDAFVRYQ
jgi:hypothetical protein